MTTEETGKILKAITALYPTFNNGREPGYTLNAWHRSFENTSFAVVNNALMDYFNTDAQGFPPTPGALRKLMKQYHIPNPMSDVEAWQEVRETLGNCYYEPQKAFDRLSPRSRCVVGSPSQLVTWCMLSEKDLDLHVRPDFMKKYRLQEDYDIHWSMLPTWLKNSVIEAQREAPRLAAPRPEEPASAAQTPAEPEPPARDPVKPEDCDELGRDPATREKLIRLGFMKEEAPSGQPEETSGELDQGCGNGGSDNR